MEKGIKKISYKVLTLVLCLCIVSGAVAPAYADNSTQNYSYYQIGSSLNRYVQSGANSADIVGRLLDISSYNQTMIYNRLLQFPTSGSDLTTVNSYITAIDSKLGVIRDSLGIGSSLENVLSNQTSNLQHLNSILSKLSYWDNSHGRSYDLSEMIFNIMGYNDSIENLLSGSAITSDWHWNDNGTWRAIGSDKIPVINRNSDGQLYLNVYPYEASNLSIKGLLQAMIRNQFYETTAIRGTYENNRFFEYTSSGAIQGDFSDNVIKSIQLLNKNSVNSSFDIYNGINHIFSDMNNFNNNNLVRYYYTRSGYSSVNNPSITAMYNYQFPNITLVNGRYQLNKYTNDLTMADMMSIINSNIVQIFNGLLVQDTQYHSYYITGEAIADQYNAYSIGDILEGINYSVANGLSDLVYMFADPLSIQAKKNNAAQETAVLDNFTGSGAASASVSDFGAVKDSIVDLKAGFTGGASSSDTFSFLSGDSNAWDWFSQNTANDVDRTQGSNTRLLRSSSSVAYDTPLLDSYYTSIMSILGGDE